MTERSFIEGLQIKQEAIAQTVQTQPRIENNQQPPNWNSQVSFSWSTAIPVISTVSLFVAWVVYDRYLRRVKDEWFAKFKRPVENMEAMSNWMQSVRGETGADRAILMEVESNRGTMIPLIQETVHLGVSKIAFSSQDNQSECVKKILQRFNDDRFISRETEQITDAPQYQGFLNSYGIAYVIYYKIGESDSTTWILALHFNFLAHVDFISAKELRQRIEQICSSIYYLLSLRSPMDGLMK